VPDRGKASSGRPFAYDDHDSAEVFSVVGSGVHQRQECDSPGGVYGGQKQKYAGQSFWVQGYFVSTSGRYEVTIRDYIRNREQEDK
jgi:REP element-mobilizing transposase RayT